MLITLPLSFSLEITVPEGMLAAAATLNKPKQPIRAAIQAEAFRKFDEIPERIDVEFCLGKMSGVEVSSFLLHVVYHGKAVQYVAKMSSDVKRALLTMSDCECPVGDLVFSPDFFWSHDVGETADLHPTVVHQNTVVLAPKELIPLTQQLGTFQECLRSAYQAKIQLLPELEKVLDQVSVNDVSSDDARFITSYVNGLVFEKLFEVQAMENDLIKLVLPNERKTKRKGTKSA